MSDLAGIIFIGQVTAIRQNVGQQDASGIVEVDFNIEQAVRGCTAGTTYTLREWAGLWEAGSERYRIGQHLLMMLHSPGPSGLTSPVDGMNGAIPVLPAASGSRMLTTATAAPQPLSNTAAPPSPVADLRWVATRLSRPLPYSTSPVRRFAAATTVAGVAEASTTSSQTTLDKAGQTPLSTVVEMLGSWQKAAP